MPHADFIHLRVHSAYSLSEGALKTKELVKLCLANRMPATEKDASAWAKSSVCDILRNPKYTGYQVFNRRAMRSKGAR